MNTRRLSLILSLSCLTLTAAYGDSFTYSYLPNSGPLLGDIITGTFNGMVDTANPNLITGISNVTLSINGNVAGGTIFKESWGPGWTTDGTSILSFDGTLNNFLFATVDFSTFPSNAAVDASEYFGMNGNYLGLDIQVGLNADHASNAGPFIQSAWKVNDLSTQAVPDSGATITMLGMAVAGLVGLRRRLH